jgi:hypothetical protein
LKTSDVVEALATELSYSDIDICKASDRGSQGWSEVFADQVRDGLAREYGGMCLDLRDVNLQRVDDATRSDDAGLRTDLNWGGAAATLESA